MTHPTKFQQAIGLWSKMESLRDEVNQLIDEMQQFDKEPWFCHFSVFLFATKPENENATNVRRVIERDVTTVGFGSPFDRHFAAYALQHPEEGTDIDK